MNQNSQGAGTIENGKKLLICSNCDNQGTTTYLAAAEGNSLNFRLYKRIDAKMTLSPTSAGTIMCGNCNTNAYYINNGTVSKIN